jgi:hypothetical protein
MMPFAWYYLNDVQFRQWRPGLWINWQKPFLTLFTVCFSWFLVALPLAIVLMEVFSEAWVVSAFNYAPGWAIVSVAVISCLATVYLVTVYGWFENRYDHRWYQGAPGAGFLDIDLARLPDDQKPQRRPRTFAEIDELYTKLPPKRRYDHV